jgi:hypothetical protein
MKFHDLFLKFVVFDKHQVLTSVQEQQIIESCLDWLIIDDQPRKWAQKHICSSAV